MGKVAFGWRVPAFPIDGSDSKSFLGQILTFLREVDGKLDSAWIADHFVPWADFQGVETDTLEAWTTLCYLAGVSRDLKLGNIVLCNSYRNPALLAKMAATIQWLTGGRFILGIGAGWKEDEYAAYGYEFPSARVRIRQLGEAVQIIKKLWTEDPVDFDGEFYRIREAHCFPKPTPRPPVMIGGGGERFTLRVVALHADWWNLANATVEEYKRKMEILKGHCRRVGRDPEEIKRTIGGHVAIAEDDQEALRIAAGNPFLWGQNWKAHFIGTPEKIAERIKEYLEIGVEYFILRFLDFPSTEGIHLFIDEVMSKI